MAVRQHWVNLNGTWQFQFDPDDRGWSQDWQAPNAKPFDRTIQVPFGWESKLSGVGDTSKTSKVGWYRRSFQVPASFPPGEHVWLRFGAVDYQADVWVNGRKAASHEGGYTPFAADITDLVTRDAENVVVVRAFDATDPELPTGKQVGWYTPTSGIWQTVWLESRPQSYIEQFRFETRPVDDGSGAWSVDLSARLVGLKKGKYRLSMWVAGPGGSQAAVPADGADPIIEIEADQTVDGPASQARTRWIVGEPKLWSPESPHLYDCAVSLTRAEHHEPLDRVESYFGLRTIERKQVGSEPFERIVLNGQPVYLRLALDQSFNPDGLYTAPDDQFFKADLELARSVGLNGLRIHIKPEEPRRLYWADKLGLLIMQDMPNTWRQTARARAAWEHTMRETIARDINHPSIFAWVAFNETWGLGKPADYKADKDTQQWVKRMVAAIRELDSTRLVEDNSPCNEDHVAGSDLNSWHFYIDNDAQASKHVEDVVARSEPGSSFNYCPGEVMNSAPLINSEYGSVSAGGGDRDVSWGFRHLTTQLRKYPRIQGYIYTELTDIEWEHNGFANYDRTPKVFGYDAFVPGMTPADLQGPDFVGYDGPPVLAVRPGEPLRVPIFVSHYSTLDTPPTLRAWVVGVNDQGQRDQKSLPDRPVTWSNANVVTQPMPLELTINGPFVGAVGFELVDAGGKRLAANFVNVVVRPAEPAPRVERLDDHHVAIRFAPGDFASSKWSESSKAIPGKVAGWRSGELVYRLALPPSVVDCGVKSVQARLELATSANRGRVDWPTRKNKQDQPQTDARPWPGRVLIEVGNAARAVTAPLPDEPADARGVLSHLKGVDHGSFGYLIEARFDLNPSADTRMSATNPLVVRLSVPEGDAAAGLSLFGADMGSFPFDPTLILTTEATLPADLGADPTASLAVDRANQAR